MHSTRQILSEIAFSRPYLPPRDSDDFIRLIWELSAPVMNAYNQASEGGDDSIVAAMTKVEELFRERGFLALPENDRVELAEFIASEVGFDIDWSSYQWPSE
jgi:hypothetical protein